MAARDLTLGGSNQKSRRVGLSDNALSINEASGFAIAADTLPVIAVNRNDASHTQNI